MSRAGFSLRPTRGLGPPRYVERKPARELTRFLLKPPRYLISSQTTCTFAFSLAAAGAA
jgi:hypothetical protein